MVSRKSNSITGLKYISQAAKLAKSIKQSHGSKRMVIDGFIVEGKRCGSLSSATVLDLPLTVLQLGNDTDRYSTNSQYNYYALNSLRINNRDILNPNVKGGGYVEYINDRYPPLIVLAIGNLSGFSPLIHSIGLQTIDKNGFANCNIGCDLHSNSLSNQTITIYCASPTGPSNLYRGMILQCSALESDMGGGTIKLVQQSIDYRDRTITETVKFLHRPLPIENTPVGWHVDGKNQALSMVSFTDAVQVPWGEEPQELQNYLYNTDHLVLFEMNLDSNGQGYEFNLNPTMLGSLLPSWLKDTVSLSRPVRNYDKSTDESGKDIYTLTGGHWINVSAPNSRVIRFKSVMVMDDGTVVIGGVLKQFVDITIPFDLLDESQSWPIPIYINSGNDYSSTEPYKWMAGGYGRYNNNECAFIAVCSVKIKIKDSEVISFEVFDVDAIAAKSIMPYVSVPGFSFSSDTFSADMTIDILADGRMLCRRKILERPESQSGFTTAESYYGNPKGVDFDHVPAAPFYKTTLDGVEVNNFSSGTDNSRTHTRFAHILHSVKEREIMALPPPVKVSKTTTIIQWFEPLESNEERATAITFTDGDRFQTELIGACDTKRLIGVSCPQHEVRDDNGNIVVHATVIACYSIGSKVYARVRKGPIWSEDFEAGTQTVWDDPFEIKTDISSISTGALLPIVNKLYKSSYGNIFG